MQTVYIIKMRSSSGKEDIVDVCTNKLLCHHNVGNLTKITDSLIFKESGFIDSLPRYKFNYSNLVKFLNRLDHRHALEIDIYRFVDEHEKMLLSTLVIQKWNVNNVNEDSITFDKKRKAQQVSASMTSIQKTFLTSDI